MDKKSIFIYGGGGHGKVILDMIIAAHGPESIAGVFDDNPAKKGQEYYSTTIIGPINNFNKPINQLILAIGNNSTRKVKALACREMTDTFAVLIDPSVVASDSAIIGEGTVVMPGAHINANARIGKHCIINTGAIIEHDCIIDDYAHVAPGVVLTGAVEIGELSLIGANSTIVPGVKIGVHCLIGAGSVVTQDVPDNTIVRGNPARVIKTKK